MADDALVLSLAPCVEQIARKIHRGLPKHVEIDDITSAGWIGAMRAVDLYSPDHGTSLVQYAAVKIRSAILDYLRTQDHLSRDHRRQVRESGQELPAPLSIDAPVIGDKAMQVSDPFSGESIKTAEGKELILKLFQRAKLDRRYSYVVRRHLLAGVELDEIAKKLNLSPSRCSQILTLGLKKLRAAYESKRQRKWKDPGLIDRSKLIQSVCQNPRCGRIYEHLPQSEWYKEHRLRRYCTRSCGNSATYAHERKLPDASELQRLYAAGMSLSQIGARFSVHKKNVAEALKKSGFKRRSISAAVKLWAGARRSNR